MNEQIKMEYRFFFQKTTISIICVFLTFYFLSILYSTGISNGWLYLDAFREEYQDEFIKDSLLIINFTYLSLVIFTGIFMHSQAHQNLAKYIVDYPLKKIEVFFSNIFFQLFVLLLYITIISIAFILILNTFTPFNISHDKLWFCLKLMVIEGIFYLALINSILIIFQHILIGLIPIALMWYMEINANIYIINSSEILKNIYSWIPSIIYSNKDFIALIDFVSSYLIIISLILVSLTIYLRRDIL
ncbi:MAG: hypothetical protein B6I17_00105 [Tenericutes bacterium 4572_104]|nr:MAG: hypothetical protein B6I17_00105 [Tenericutes bacterium 4572_104]